MARRKGLALLVKRAAGSFALLAVSLVPLSLLFGALPRFPISPANAWVVPFFLCFLGFSLAVALFLFWRGIPLGYGLWAHTVVSVLVFFAHYGILRREDSFRRYPDPDAPGAQGPETSLEGILLVASLGLCVAYLPLGLRAMKVWITRRRYGVASVQGPISTQDRSPPPTNR